MKKQNKYYNNNESSNKQNILFLKDGLPTISYRVINETNEPIYKPMCLDSFLKAMEKYLHGQPMSKEQRELLIKQQLILDKGLVK